MEEHARSDHLPATPVEYSRGRWTRRIVLGLGLIAAGGLFAFDREISRAAVELAGDRRGDLWREFELLAQFGAVTSVALTAIVVWLLDPPRRRRLLDLIAATLGSWLVVSAIKLLVGRPRPRFDDPGIVLTPFGVYPLAEGHGVAHAWQFWRDGVSDLWSIPSAHTAAAAALAVWLGITYPKLRGLLALLVLLVASSRVLFGAHYASDVVIGAAIAFAFAHASVTGWWGVRGLDWLWLRVVNRNAPPAFTRAYQHESSERRG